MKLFRYRGDVVESAHLPWLQFLGLACLELQDFLMIFPLTQIALLSLFMAGGAEREEFKYDESFPSDAAIQHGHYIKDTFSR